MITVIQREVFMTRITVGTEDVMLDLYIREMMKRYEKETKELNGKQAKI